MPEQNWLADRFEENRTHLRSVAYRMLGSLSEADDAVQEGWFRLSRADTSRVENLRGWLTTVIARVCLDMLRSRTSRREEPLAGLSAQTASPDDAVDPEQQVLLAESVGLALLVVLQTLPPAERVAFVLHDMFGVPFDEIAPIVGRSPTAARQLASRGLGRWTADMFLLINLRRPDVLPIGDLGIRSAVRRLYRLDHLPTPREVDAIGETWRPNRSLASLYLWASSRQAAG
jgi:RNA polymerase sigma factor (sigma-70 family)